MSAGRSVKANAARIQAFEMTVEYSLRRSAILVSVQDAILTVVAVASTVIALLIGGPGAVVAAMIAGVMTVALLVSRLLLRRKLAKRLAVTDRGLDAWPFAGRKISMKWDEISTVGAHSSTPVYGALRRTHVIARDGRRIVFTDLISDYDDLVTTIERSATSRDPTPQQLSWWERLLLLG